MKVSAKIPINNQLQSSIHSKQGEKFIIDITPIRNQIQQNHGPYQISYIENNLIKKYSKYINFKVVWQF